MKLRTFLAMALIALCTVSCSDDDEMVEIEQEIEASAQVAGSYPGVIAKAVGSPSGAYDATIQIKDQKDGKVTIEFPGESGSGMAMKAFTLTDVEVKSVSAKEFTFEHAAFTVNVGIEYKSKGLKGSLKDGILTLAYDIQPGGMPMAINLTFTNDKDAMFAAKVVGKYKGATFLTVMNSASNAYLGDIEIKAQEGGKFMIVTPKAGEGMMSMPSLTIKDVVIKSTGANEYSIEHEKFTLDDKYLFEKGLNGTLKNGKLSLEYAIKPGAMPMAINHVFNMDKELMGLIKFSKKYAGSVIMSVGSMKMDPMEAAYELVAQVNGKMTLKFPKFDMGKMVLPEFSVGDVAIKVASDDEFTIECGAFEREVGKDKMKLVNKNGVKGSFKDGQLTLDYDIIPGAMGMPINFHFGKKVITEGPAAAVAGEYKGKFAMSMKGEAAGEFDGTIKVVATEEGKATVTVEELNPFGSMKIPAINLEEVEVKAVSETEFSLTHAAFTLTLGDGKECVSQKGLKGSVKDKILTLEFDMKYGGMPHVLDLKFVSAK